MESASGIHVLMTADDGKLPGNVTESNREEYLANRRLFEIDQYYPSIEQHTFSTSFVDLTEEEGWAWRKDLRGARLNTGEQSLVDGLNEKLSAAMSRFAGKVFVRLSTRSPKDAVDKLHGRLVPLLSEEIDVSARSLRVAPRDLDANAQLVAIRRAFFRSLAVTSAREVMEIMSMSSRVVSDLVRALDNLDKSPWNMKFIVREFVSIPIEGEFRAFVCNGSLNALSQYYDDCFFQYHVDNEQRITLEILAFFERVKPAIQLDSYVCDFAILSNWEVKIVELNPFTESTGACLFDWKTDINVIENGPFEFRFIQRVNELVRGSLMPWKALFDKAHENLDAASKKQEESKKTAEPSLSSIQFGTPLFIFTAVVIVVLALNYGRKD